MPENRPRRAGRLVGLFMAGVIALSAVAGGPLAVARAAELPAGGQTGATAAPAPAGAPNYLHTDGAKIVDSEGKEVTFSGASWFGMETNTLSPHGLWARSLDDMLDQFAKLGFNTIRLPYSSEIFAPDAMPTAIDYTLNPDLQKLNAIQLLDQIVMRAGQRGIKIILDRHRSTSDGQDKLWYTDEVSEQQWIDGWRFLAERYKDNDTIIGADLHNEPAGDATWGTDDLKTDWRLAAERAGNAIHEVNPNWLILVEGIEKTQDEFGGVLGWYWMGGSLQYARQYPVRLKVPNKLVYSPHDYGPGVWELQGWFMDPEFPGSLPKTWNYFWGYLVKENIAPVIVGEFGGRSMGDDAEGQWQRTLVQFLKDNRIGYLYWSYNGNSGDTGGILKDDWTSVEEEKMAVLRTHMGEKMAVNNPNAVNTSVAMPQVGPLRDVKLLHRDDTKEKWVKEMKPILHLSNKTGQPVDASNLEARYWFTAEGNDQIQQVKVAKAFAAMTQPVDIGKIHAELVRDQASDEGQGPVWYIKLTFDKGLLVPAKDTLGIELSVTKRDGSTYFLGNDYSFREYHWQVAREKVNLYRDGKLIWGKEPLTFRAEEKAKEELREQKLAEKAAAVKAAQDNAGNPVAAAGDALSQIGEFLQGLLPK